MVHYPYVREGSVTVVGVNESIACIKVNIMAFMIIRSGLELPLLPNIVFALPYSYVWCTLAARWYSLARFHSPELKYVLRTISLDH